MTDIFTFEYSSLKEKNVNKAVKVVVLREHS